MHTMRLPEAPDLLQRSLSGIEIVADKITKTLPLVQAVVFAVSRTVNPILLTCISSVIFQVVQKDQLSNRIQWLNESVPVCYRLVLVLALRCLSPLKISFLLLSVSAFILIDRQFSHQSNDMPPAPASPASAQANDNYDQLVASRMVILL